MRLLTYNFLTSKSIKGVTVGYPLKLHIKKQETVQSEFNSEFITRMIPRLHWPAICLASESVGMSSDIPKELGDNIASDQELLQKLHHLLLEIDIIEGHLECPETGRIFPIADGIPNMLLNEDEV